MAYRQLKNLGEVVTLEIKIYYNRISLKTDKNCHKKRNFCLIYIYYTGILVVHIRRGPQYWYMKKGGK